jgi:hypothetical protein
VVDWLTDGGTWTETGGALTGVPASASGTARAVAKLPWTPSGDFGSSICTIQATFESAGGAKSRVSLVGWHQDWQNYIELRMEEEANKWTLSQIVGGVVSARKSFSQNIVSNTGDRAEIRYDGSTVTFLLSNVPVATLPAVGTLNGNVGFKVNRTTGSFRDMLVE